MLSCDQECSFIRNKNTKSQLLTHYVKQRERQLIFSISRTIFWVKSVNEPRKNKTKQKK